MDPEEANGAQPLEESPAVEPVAPEAEPLVPEALDDGGMTPPHGDPWPLGVPTAISPEASVAEPLFEEPLDDASLTPPHGDPLHLATATVPESADLPSVLLVEEALDDASLTPPHGDPLQSSIATASGPESADLPAVSLVEEPLDSASSTPPHGDPLHLATANVPESVDLPSVSLVDEALDVASLTTPHGDPLQSSIATAGDPASAAIAPEPLVEEPLDDASLTPPHGDPLRVSAAPTATWTTAEAHEVAAAPAWGSGEAPAEFGADGFQVSGIDGAAVEAEGAQREFADRSEYHSDPEFASSATVLESLYSRDASEGEGTQPADALEAAALGHPSSTDPGVATVEEVEAPEERREGGPNWMLAFICAWSGATSLVEAWTLTRSGGLRVELLQNLGFVGYLLLGLGLAVFAIEALGWGRPRRGVAPVLLPTALTLAGVVCLVLWNDPGRPI